MKVEREFVQSAVTAQRPELGGAYGHRFTGAQETDAWASSGAMHLTGDADGAPLNLPWSQGSRIASLARSFGLDARILSERAAAAGLSRAGQRSCGGSARLLRARDGWFVMNLPRESDFSLLPALFGEEVGHSVEAWSRIEAEVSQRTMSELDSAAALLGIPAAAFGAHTAPFGALGAPRARTTSAPRPLVLDLSALWAGPLCAHLLQRCGARVIKVEDAARPDGARFGPKAFFSLINGGKESVRLDLRFADGRARLLALMGAVDVVVTSARARAFDQLGIDPVDVLASASDKVWVAITAYGWDVNRVGFGDDAAVGAGLVAWHPVDGEPRFVADAVADPVCGVAAADLALAAWARGGRWFVDASLNGAASHLGVVAEAAEPAAIGGRPGEWHIEGVVVEPPRQRATDETARPPGADTEAVLAELAR